jgi:predicted DNA-binding transcriptional regulator AlpA
MAENKATKYVTAPQVCQRYQCCHMTLERKIKSDPAFPRPIQLGGPGSKRLFALDQLEAYEQQKVVGRKAGAK